MQQIYQDDADLLSELKEEFVIESPPSLTDNYHYPTEPDGFHFVKYKKSQGDARQSEELQVFSKRKASKSGQIDQEIDNYSRLQRIKLFGLVQQRDIIDTQAFIHVVQVRAIGQPLIRMNQDADHQNTLILQLALTLNELLQRGIMWNYWQEQAFSIVEDRLLLNQAFYNPFLQVKKSIHRLMFDFKQFVINNFPQSNLVPQLLDQDTLTSTIQLLQIELQLISKQMPQIPHQKTIEMLLRLKEPEQILSEGNSVVVVFRSNELMKTFFGKTTGDRVICKTVLIPEVNNAVVLLNIKREIESLEHFGQEAQGILPFYGYLRIGQFPFLFQPRFETTLEKYIQKHQGNSKSFTKVIVATIGKHFIEGLKSLHSLNIIHRDLKPVNLFMNMDNVLDHDFQLIIADFDRSKKIQAQEENMLEQTNTVFTPLYSPPDEEHQSKSFDIWQFGYIILQLVNHGLHLHSHRQLQLLSEDQYQRVFSMEAINRLKGAQAFPSGFLELLAQCVAYDPKQRPDCNEISKEIKKHYLGSKVRITG